MNRLINEKLENVYKAPCAMLAETKMKKIEIKNEKTELGNNRTSAKILFSALKVCNGVVYKIVVFELGNGKRGLIIERQSTDRLPRAIIAKPPAPLLPYVRKLKQIYGIE
jgi:hypothetical protein